MLCRRTQIIKDLTKKKVLKTVELTMALIQNINTLVFFDTETTGLPAFECGRTRITELTLIAVGYNDLVNSSSPMQMPRVLNKLSLCLNPMKLIDLRASEITGLTNDLLEHQGLFDETVHQLLHRFLQRLPQPVCLLAHNGRSFDFPILAKELKNIGKELDPDVLCADTLSAYRQLLAKNNKIPKKNLWPAKTSTVSVETGVDEASDVGTHHSSQDSIQQRKRKTLKENHIDSRKIGKTDDEILDEELVSFIEDITKLEELALKNTNSSIIMNVEECKISVDSKIMQIVNETTPSRQIHRSQPPVINFRNLMLPPGSPKSFKLVDLFSFLLKRPPPYDLHNAEGDTMMLLQCAAATGTCFLDWVNANAVPFNTFMLK